MKIIVKNCSSPGASFTDNTNSVMLETYDWIVEHDYPTMPFKNFRMSIQSDKGINDNNNRNIYPLLRNCGFIKYDKGEELNTKNFFTRCGLAYVKALETKRLIEKADYTKEKKNASLKEIKKILSQLIYDGLKMVLKTNAEYVDALSKFIEYLLRFGKINKVEFGLLLYAMENNPNNILDSISNWVEDYRNGSSTFDIVVNVRNDIELRDRTNSSRRNEGLSYLTSYSYFIGLLQQADLVYKEEDYYFIGSLMKEKLKALLEE